MLSRNCIFDWCPVGGTYLVVPIFTAVTVKVNMESCNQTSVIPDDQYLAVFDVFRLGFEPFFAK